MTIKFSLHNIFNMLSKASKNSKSSKNSKFQNNSGIKNYAYKLNNTKPGKIYYGVFVPKLTKEGNSILYKGNLVCSILDHEVIGAETFDINTLLTFPIDHTEVIYNPLKSKYFNKIEDTDETIFKGDGRYMFLYSSKIEAIIAKMVLLKGIREAYIKRLEDDRKYLDLKIDPAIGDIIKKSLSNHPEIML